MIAVVIAIAVFAGLAVLVRRWVREDLEADRELSGRAGIAIRSPS